MIQVDQAKIATLCKLIEAILIDPKTPQLSQDPAKATQILAGIFIFAYTWAIAGMLTEDGWEAWDTFIREQMEDNNDCRLPQGKLYDSAQFSRDYCRGSFLRSILGKCEPKMQAESELSIAVS